MFYWTYNEYRCKHVRVRVSYEVEDLKKRKKKQMTIEKPLDGSILHKSWHLILCAVVGE